MPHYASDLYAFKVGKNTICQFTEQFSKNGTMIWEYDIVQYENGRNSAFGVIKFGNNNKTCGFYIEWYSEKDKAYLRNDLAFWIQEKNLKVIGNVFDNPNLLKGDVVQ